MLNMRLLIATLKIIYICCHMHLLRLPFQASLPYVAPKAGLLRLPFARLQFPFSEYFREKDKQEMQEFIDRKTLNKKYRGLIALWKKPLEKKRLRQARIREIKANLLVQYQSSHSLLSLKLKN